MVQLAYDKIFVSFCREIARMLADEHMKRVVIVDTSNEIGGDGDVPHEGIGRARRMQVPNVNMQHNVSFFFFFSHCKMSKDLLFRLQFAKLSWVRLPCRL